ncbi:hypothetical protein HYU94_03425 [Candidatus Daviesbacteria bacterium]|nr:hypothetical protein [Candidatus Daviesbacteria bacterium]
MNNQTLPSIGQLFKDAWQTFTQSILQLFLLNIVGIVIYLALGLLAVLVFILSGAGSSLLQKGLEGAFSGLFSSPQALTTTIIIAVIFTVLYAIVGSILQISSILIIDTQGKGSLWNNLKKSFGLIIPLMLVGILTFILSFGALFVLILPALLFYFLLSFVQFEVILNNQRWIGAIKRSVMLVSKHFGAIAIRLVILLLIYFVYSLLVNLLGKIGPDTAIIVNAISFIINLLLGWFALAYTITLYKQARVGLEQEQGKGIIWMWVITILGWLIAAGIFFAGYKTISSGVLNGIFEKSTGLPSPGRSIQRAIEDMQPQTKIHYDKSSELFKQMRELKPGSGKTDAQIVAEIKNLNDENIAELKKALEIEPNNHRIWYELGNAYTWQSSQGRLEDSLTAFKKAEELDSNNVLYINGVGDMLIQMGKYEEAVLHFQKTLRLTDKSGYANLSVAQAYAKLKIYDSAKEHYQKAIGIFNTENNDGSFDDEILQAKKELSNLPR